MVYGKLLFIIISNVTNSKLVLMQQNIKKLITKSKSQSTNKWNL